MSIWNKLTLRESTEEEKEVTGFPYQWEGPTPELFERVLVMTEGLTTDDAYFDVWMDFFDGQVFEDTDVDVGETIYWASIPEFDLEC